MKLTNDQYVIRFRGRSWRERYWRDAKGWVKSSAAGNRYRMTAEQVLNHLLPALAGVKRGLDVTVEHKGMKKKKSAKRVSAGACGTARAPSGSARGRSRRSGLR